MVSSVKSTDLMVRFRVMGDVAVTVNENDSLPEGFGLVIRDMDVMSSFRLDASRTRYQ